MTLERITVNTLYCEKYYRFKRTEEPLTWILYLEDSHLPHFSGVISDQHIQVFKEWILSRYNILESNIVVEDRYIGVYDTYGHRILLVFNSEEDEAVFIMGKN